MGSKKIADLPYEQYNVSDWVNLQNQYRKKFSKRTNKEHWIFRAETRRKKDNHKDILKSDEKNGVTPSNSKCYKVENEEGSYFQTSLGKAFVRFEPDKPCKNGKRYSRRDLEINLIREFQRKAHHNLQYVPELNNRLEWLTLMQHYGGPTRLLDWTYSFYVALFFALTRLDCDTEYAEVWAANAKWIGNVEKKIYTTKKLRNLSKLRKKDPINMDDLHNAILDQLFTRNKKLVIILNSFRLNNRLIIQQGTFLVQGNIDVPFDDNLKSMGTVHELKKNLHRIVIDIEAHQRNEVLRDLSKMNIEYATLFPGLQGFAKSLETQLAYPEKFGIDKKKAKK